VNLLTPIGTSPGMLALSILISTYFLEDVAIGYAGLLAAAGAISPPFAFAALFAGVYTGDLGLYFLGAAARNFQPARRLVGEERLSRAGRWLDERAIAALIAARVVPGSRLPVYAAGGYLRLPVRIFASTTAATSLVWTLLLFIAAYAFGIGAADLPWRAKFAIILVIGLIAIGIPIILNRRLKRLAVTPAG